MIRTGLIALVACVSFAALPRSAHAANVTLVKDGKPLATIVVAREALKAEPKLKPDQLGALRSRAVKTASAALDLQSYIEKMTGAKLPIVGDEKEPEGVVILVGRNDLTKPFDKKIPDGLTEARAEEGLLIMCQGRRLVLAGNDQSIYCGTEYAVAEFLHRLGVRWFMPGEYGDYVPKQTTIEFPEGEIVQKPSFKIRNWWGPMPQSNLVAEFRWKIHNRMNPTANFVALPGDSSVRGLLPADLVKTEPELFALEADGKRNPFLPNLTNPKAAQRAAATIKELFKKDPNATSFGFAPDDGLPRDFNPETLKKNVGFPDVSGRVGVKEELNISEEWFAFVNQAAREVAKDYPKHVLTSNGYANRNTPPIGTKLEPNVWIMFAAIWSDTLHAYDNPLSWQTVRQGQMLERWGQLCPNVFMYNYTYIMLASGGTPVPLARKYRHDMPLLKKWGIIGFYDEGRRVLAESGIAPPYLRARLMWDAGQESDAILDDFFTKWYGPAAKPARAFWDALEKTIESTPMVGHEDRILPYVYSRELLEELEKHLSASEMAADGETTKKHVKADRLTLEHLKGYMRLHHAEWKGDFLEAVKQADFMFEQRKQLHAISPFYMMPDDKTIESGFYYWGLNARRDYYQKLAELTTGKTGAMVALLPEKASFSIDPRDEGRFAGWFKPEFADKAWQTLSTTVPFYAQGDGYRDRSGYPYMGAMWYRFALDVPADAKGKTIKLYAPAIETEAWGWVNGQYVGHRPYREAYERPNEIDFDVSEALKPGERNVIALRLHTGLGAAQQAAGMTSRAFLYSPKK